MENKFAGRQVRIFVPNEMPRVWSDQLLAKVIRPIVESKDLKWFWFSRYHGVEGLNGFDTNDCVWKKVPRAYRRFYADGTYATRSVRFRFEAKSPSTEKRIKAAIRKHDGWFSDVRAYDPIADLGSPTMIKLCETACRVVLENLDEDGYMKSAEAFRNLEQMHHRVCNISHLTDYRKFGREMVSKLLEDFDNLRYDSMMRDWPL